MKVKIQDLMESSGVGFGTSGARGLASEMTDRVCYAYTCGFLQHLRGCGDLPRPQVAIAGDLRPSTPRIIAAVCRASADMGCTPILCGPIPSPAVALYGIRERIPAIMVTGSHIPDDRNGIKFNKPAGEILKSDEAAIRDQVVALDPERFDAGGSLIETPPAPLVCEAARQAYLDRYLNFFPPGALAGMYIGVYQHSAVGRDLLVETLSALGARTMALGRSERFVPVDTEAIRPEDTALALEWSRQRGFDAIVSTDGDSDRPLIADQNGRWLRGDVAGILCARFLGADWVCAPVSCNTALEKCGWFEHVERTRIGSPYVIEAMLKGRVAGGRRVVGYEANGGFLTQSDIEKDGRKLEALPTRDALIVILAVLCSARREEKSVGNLLTGLPQRYTASDRLKNFARPCSAAILRYFDDAGAAQARIETAFGHLCGRLAAVDRSDGLRMTFANQEVIHLRPSGNAPEFRCYNEAADPERAEALNAACLRILSQMQPEAGAEKG